MKPLIVFLVGLIAATDSVYIADISCNFTDGVCNYEGNSSPINAWTVNSNPFNRQSQLTDGPLTGPETGGKNHQKITQTEKFNSLIAFRTFLDSDVNKCEPQVATGNLEWRRLLVARLLSVRF